MIELSEAGPADGTVMAVPEDQDLIVAFEWDGGTRYRVTYSCTDRRNPMSGNRIYARDSRVRVET